MENACLLGCDRCLLDFIRSSAQDDIGHSGNFPVITISIDVGLHWHYREPLTVLFFHFEFTIVQEEKGLCFDVWWVIVLKNYFLICLAFLYTSSALFAMEQEPSYYLRHITRILPAPIMLVGGIPSTYRPTLHWSLLGTKPFMIREHLSMKDGTTTRSSLTLDDTEHKYGIIESLRNLAPKVIGGEYFDIFTFGSHEPSTQAYLFVPNDEIINTNIYKCTIVTYDSTAMTVSEAIDKFAVQNNIKYIKFASPALLADQPLEQLHARVQFINDIIKVDPKMAFGSMLDVEDMATIEGSGNLFKPCLSTKISLEDESCDLAILAVFIRGQKFILLWIGSGSEDSKLKLMRYFWYNSSELVCFDTVLFAQEFDSLRTIFQKYEISLDWCNIGHHKSKLRSLEKGIQKIPYKFAEKWKIYRQENRNIIEIFDAIKIEMNNEYKALLEKHHHQFPAAFAEKLMTFFEKTHNEMIESHISQLFTIIQVSKAEGHEKDMVGKTFD